MKQKMIEKDGVQTEVAEDSVETMEELGWKVVGDAPDSPEPRPPRTHGVEVVVASSVVPSWMVTKDVLETVMAGLPTELPNAESVLAEIQGVFGSLVGEDHSAYVRSLQVASKAAQEDAGDVGKDPDYSGMTKADIKELLDAKGVVYEERDNKDKLVERLKASKTA